jgi:hypothetical protein
MKIATRLTYLLAILVFGAGIYLAVLARKPGSLPVEPKPVATSRLDRALASAPKKSNPPNPLAEAAPAARRPWVFDEKTRDEMPRFVPPKTFDYKIANAIANQIRVRARFGELYDLLGLDKAESARFEMAAAEAGLTFSELVGSNAEAIQGHREGQARSMDKIVTATLGADYVTAFRGYLETSDLRLMTSDLAVNSFNAGTPLSPSQADRLIQLSVDNHEGPVVGSRIDPDAVNWEAVAGRVGEFLTPVQIQSLQAMLAKRRFDAEFKRITGLPLRRPVHGI